MAYTPTNWEDSPSVNTPITAARLNKIEAGIFQAAPLDTVSVLSPSPDIRAVSSSGSFQRMTLPTHLADKIQATHPSVKFFPEGWNGWRYWMGFTPYPSGNDAHEDPCLAVSQDGKTWTTPTGFSNPLADAPGGTVYNADSELAISPDGATMYYMWRRANTSTRTVDFLVRSSTDGVTWTPEVVAMSHPDYNVANYVSPSLLHDGTQWVMWAVDTATDPNRLVRLTAASVLGPWSSAVACTASAGANRDFWHVSVVRTVDGYLALMNDTTLNVTGGDGDLYLMTSTDGLTWKSGIPVVKRPLGTQFTNLYRGALVPTDYGFEMWFGAYNNSNFWAIYRTELYSSPGMVETSEKWIPAQSFRPPVVGATEGNLVGTVNGWLLDPAAVESISTSVSLLGWKRFAAEVWFSTTSTNSGGVVFGLNYYQFPAEGGTLSGPPILYGAPVTAPSATNRFLKSRVISSLLTGSEQPWYFRVVRNATDPSDTYPDDVLFLGLKLIRVA